MSAFDEFLQGPYGILSIFAIILIFTTLTIIFYLKKDKYDPEPLSKIIIAFVIGVFSILPALFLSIIGFIIYIYVISDNLVGTAIIVAPIAEEIAKGLFVIAFSQSDEFDGPLDGLVYGAMIGAGFAAAENLLYAYQVTVGGSIFSGVVLATIRSATQIIGHPFYTGLFGVGVGEAKVGLKDNSYHRLWQSILLHAAWNAAASLGSWYFVPALIIVIIICIVILRKQLKRAIELDREAYERGYYEQKQRYMEQKRKQKKQRAREIRLQQIRNQRSEHHPQQKQRQHPQSPSQRQPTENNQSQPMQWVKQDAPQEWPQHPQSDQQQGSVSNSSNNKESNFHDDRPVKNNSKSSDDDSDSNSR